MGGQEAPHLGDSSGVRRILLVQPGRSSTNEGNVSLASAIQTVHEGRKNPGQALALSIGYCGDGRRGRVEIVPRGGVVKIRI